MSNKTYDILKWIGTVVLPAITTLWLTIGHIRSYSCSDHNIRCSSSRYQLGQVPART